MIGGMKSHRKELWFDIQSRVEFVNITRDVAERHGMRLEFRASEYGGLHVELAGPLLAGAEGG